MSLWSGGYTLLNSGDTAWAGRPPIKGSNSIAAGPVSGGVGWPLGANEDRDGGEGRGDLPLGDRGTSIQMPGPVSSIQEEEQEEQEQEQEETEEEGVVELNVIVLKGKVVFNCSAPWASDSSRCVV